MFAGFVELDSTLNLAMNAEDSNGTPKDPTNNPTYRIYNGEALASNGTGTLSKLDTHTVTGAANASPIVITTSSAHNLETNNRVVVSGVLGNTAANGEFTITDTGSTTLSLNGSTGNGPYTSGGTVHVAGLYKFSHSIASGDGYERGKTYTIRVTYTISSTVYTDSYTFTVV